MKITSHVAKKLPVPGVDFSSVSYSCGAETEIGEGASQEEIRQKLHAMYQLLSETVDSELTRATQPAAPPTAQQPTVPQTPVPVPVQAIGTPATAPRGRASNGRKITDAQARAIAAISRSAGLSREQVLVLARRDHGVETIEALSVSQASKFIDFLQAQAGNNKKSA